MAALTLPERLAVLESLNVHLQADVTEIKRDVKQLAQAQSHLAADLAAKTTTIATELAAKTAAIASDLALTQSADNALTGARASTGVWVRAIVPWFLAGMGAVLTVISLFR